MSNLSTHLLMVAITFFVVGAASYMHYAILNYIQVKIPTACPKTRLRIFWVIICAIFAHMLEIGLFGLAIYFCIQFPAMGSLSGATDGSFFDCLFFATATFTTAGYGDIAPVGPLRTLAGIESLTGFVLITWTASFTYLKMSREWQ